MKTKIRLYAISFLLLPFTGLTQQPDTLIKKLDSLSKKTDSTGGQTNNINRAAYNENTKINVPVYFILLGSDMKQEITAPFHFHKKSWIKAGAIVLATVSLSFADEPVQRFALHLRNNNKGVENVSKYVTKFGGVYEMYTLGALAAYGVIRKSEKIKTTTLLATQSYLTAGAMEYLIKFLTGRQRPADSDPATEPEPKFHGPFTQKITSGTSKGFSSGFPSGHTTAAFAAATVFAMEYRDRPIVPIIAYSVAGLIGLSRLTENKHWITDVFAGAVLGYFTGRQVVNNYHRYARIKASQQKKNTVLFNLQYNYNHFMPGLIYTFR
jgi:membrane-associated PAP2 superfamily phosphatase